MPANGGRVAQQFAPLFHRAVRGHHRAGPLVASHHDFQEFFGRGQRQPAHAGVIDDEQRHGEQGLQEVFALAVEGRFDGEDSNYGLVDIQDRPYQEFVEAVRKANAAAWEAHQKAIS